MDADLYNNAGHTLDLSLAVMERGVSHADNAYYIPVAHVRGHVCKTNLPSNTAFRGFGGPQGMLMTEMFMDKVTVVQVMHELNVNFKGKAEPYLRFN